MKAAISAIVVALVLLAAWAAFDTLSPGAASRPDAEVPEGAEPNDPLDGASAKRAPGLEAALVGEWQSDTDSSFARVFEADGRFYDTYEGSPAGAPGTWQLATDGSEELWLDSEGDRLRFRVVSVSSSSLELIYLDRGGSLRFTKVD